jgi:Ribonucleases G and E
MKKEIYINESMGETRIAIMEDGQLVEVYIEKQDKHRMVGNVYRGVVKKYTLECKQLSTPQRY